MRICPLQLFVMLGQLPLTAITSFLGIVLVIVFFVTSSDSGSLVIDTITAGGKVDAPKPQRVFWATDRRRRWRSRCCSAAACPHFRRR